MHRQSSSVSRPRPAARPSPSGRGASDSRASESRSTPAKAAPAAATPRPAPTLNTRQRSHLRGLGHHLDPVVHIGKDGLTEGLQAAVERALDQHELLKLKLSENAPGERFELSAAIATQCRAALVQVLGRTLLLYRRRPDGDDRPHIPLG
jgi:RNA-binding protein